MSQRSIAARRTPENMVDALLAGVLGRDHRGARVRTALVVVGLLAYWLTLSFFADFPRMLPDELLRQLIFPLNVVLDLVTSLFAPQVLLHLIPVGAGLWIGMRLASLYLTDLFELEAPAIADRYLQSSIFGLGYDTLNVDQAEVEQLNQSSPLLRIGGPGYLQVHLGFAVVMETSNGLPRVYGPDQRRFIEGFERLRDVVDLRDQLREIDEVRAVTADGIEVHARDVQMVFRVYGGGQNRSLEAPYPYTESAIRRLVYGRPVTEDGTRPLADELAELATTEIRSFVSSLTLEAFLALQPEGPGTDSESDRTDLSGAPGVFHISRSRLTDRFHTPEAKARLQEHGLELDWVGVGTWEVAGGNQGSVSIGKSIVGAWQDQQRSRLLQSPSYLTRQQERGYQDGARRPLEGWVAVWRSDDFNGRHRCFALLKHIRNDLHALSNSLEEDVVAPPPDLQATLEHLDQLTHTQRLGGASD
ncbi:MAG: hypothetical protein WBR18_06540 [Anaerolineales bacterium]